MTRAEKAQKILAILDELYPDPPIPLRHQDPFTLLIAVLLSAQTTDARVNEVTPALFNDGPTPATMAALSTATILRHIRTLGLAPTKAKRVKALAQQLVDEFDGEVPRDFAGLESLPGVGHKTAGVVMAQAFGEPAFPVDTHIHRLAARWGLSTGKTVELTERDLKKVFPKSRWGDAHLKIIYFAREHCPAQYHELEGCPICGWAASKKRTLAERRANNLARQEASVRLKAARKPVITPT
ncbi:Endonuclease III [Enhygromyxa salina]|uniref:Endonuclease III n=1 Tax=Enhygromyxa salina TaxID=215803 RepID=A0A0C2DB93_9BACT|nr:endonuclease III [Enhygromyxa salina]KIG17077.1 Endonuclease III [Enhygromyxa salina]